MKKIESYDEIIQDLLDHEIIKSKDEIVIEPEKLLEDKKFNWDPELPYCLEQTDRYFFYDVETYEYPINYKKFLNDEIFSKLSKIYDCNFSVKEEQKIEEGKYIYLISVEIKGQIMKFIMKDFRDYIDIDGMTELMNKVIDKIAPGEIAFEAQECFFIGKKESIEFLTKKYAVSYYA